MLRNKYKNDKIPFFNLNDTQIQAKKEVEDKINNGIYTFEATRCPICNDEKHFETLAKKDRYGLEYNTVICKKCGLLRTNPRMNQEAYNQFYDKEYRRLYTSSDTSSDIFFEEQYNHGQHILNIIKEAGLVKDFTDQYIVEIGCGAGGILKAFRDNRAHITGLDLGQSYLNYGIKKYNLSLYNSSIHNYQFDRSPDIIIYSHVLEHILDLDTEIKRIKEISNENTIIYIEVPGLLNIHNTYKSEFLMYLQNAHTYHFSLESLKNLFSKYKYETIYGEEYVRAIFRYNPNEDVESFINLYPIHKKYLVQLKNRKEVLYNRIKNKFRNVIKHLIQK